MTYPTLMYRCPGPHFAHDGQTYDYVQVADEPALIERLKGGWSVTLLEAVAVVTCKDEEADEPDEEAEFTRDELENMASELGVKFDGRTSDAGLLKKVQAALGEK